VETSACRCEVGFGGELCNLPICPTTLDGFDCSSGEDCVPKTVICSGLGKCEPINKGDVGRGEACVCNEGYSGVDCSNELPTVYQLKATFEVSVVWGIGQTTTGYEGLWNSKKAASSFSGGQKESMELQYVPFQPSFDVSEPEVQSWLLNVCRTARDPGSNLNIRSDLKTWVEILHEESQMYGFPFPIPKDMFEGYISLLLENSSTFRRRYKDEIGVSGLGSGHDVRFAALTMLTEVPTSPGGDDAEMVALRRWEKFVNDINRKAPPAIGPAVVQSSAFKDVRREDAIFSTTLSTWAIANGVCLLVVLIFTRNVSLSLIVMVTIILLAICLMGFILAVLAIDFGPIEAIGVTIFVGLSANYALHVAHAYHNAPRNTRLGKIQLTVFVTSSPVMASAISTIGACAFLLGCRLWLFVELGVILCSNTAMALVFSMSFLLSVLAVIGPLPYENERNLHQCDFKALLLCKCYRGRLTDAESEDAEIPIPKDSTNCAGEESSSEESDGVKHATFISVVT